MLPFWLKIVLFSAYLIANFVYISLLRAIHKHRTEVPFNSSFFSFVFNLGLLDLLHLNIEWLLFRLPFFGWFSMDRAVMVAPRFFATLMNTTGWVTALAQIAAVTLLAVNRVTVIGYAWIWPKRLVKACNVLLWLVPMALTAPMLVVGQLSYTNVTGGVIPYWIDARTQGIYFFGCVFWCFGSAGISGVLYIVTLYQVRKQTAEADQSGLAKDNRAELNLSIVGVVLFVLTVAYGIYCFSLAVIGNDRTLLAIAYVVQVIHGDLYSWSNPYLLLMCSTAMRRRFVELFTGRKQDHLFKRSVRSKNQVAVQLMEPLKIEDCC